ncbi:hypothetical protein GCM10027076_01050 [Nocardioides montaniterrae]
MDLTRDELGRPLTQRGDLVRDVCLEEPVGQFSHDISLSMSVARRVRWQGAAAKATSKAKRSSSGKSEAVVERPQRSQRARIAALTPIRWCQGALR